MEAHALRLGASIKHIMMATSRLLDETKPCKAMRDRVNTLTDTFEARHELEGLLTFVVERGVHKLNDGNVEFRSGVERGEVFYGACGCNACFGRNNYRGRNCDIAAPQQLTAKQLDACVRLRIRLRVWATQAHRFIATAVRRPIRRVSLHDQRTSTKMRHAKAAKATSAIKKVEKRTKTLLKLGQGGLKATRASFNWAIVRVAVRRWKLAHMLFEAKQGGSYAPGGSGAKRDIDAAMADFPFLNGSGIGGVR